MGHQNLNPLTVKSALKEERIPGKLLARLIDEEKRPKDKTPWPSMSFQPRKLSGFVVMVHTE